MKPPPPLNTLPPPDPYLEDVRLRRYGFIIAARPTRGPTLWARKGRVYTQREALAACDRELRAAGKAP